jgi:hypothetical protein
MDAYDTTDPRVIEPIKNRVQGIITGKFTFIEPCAGRGNLVNLLEDIGGTCYLASDIEPRSPDVVRKDAFELDADDVYMTKYIITNPPWTRTVLHGLIDHFLSLDRETLLLFDADWMFTRQSAPYLGYLHEIYAVGRVKWIEDSKHVGKDNAAWYLFSPMKREYPISFFGRGHD